MNISFLKILSLLVLFNLLLQCSIDKKEKHIISKEKTQEIELQMDNSVVIDIYNDKFLYMKLTTTHLAKRKNPNQLFIKPVHIKILDKNGKVNAWIQSDSGATNEDYSLITLWGKVKAYTSQKEKLYADSLVWNELENQIKTNSNIKIISKQGDIITGKGFISDKKLENWEILNNVRTKIQNIEVLK